MAATTPLEKKREKKCNFSAEEELLISREVAKNKAVIEAKQSNVITNERKKKIWIEIAGKVSSLGVAERTVKEVKDKWNNSKKKAKKTFTEYSKEIRKTGGGPAPKAPSQAIQTIIDSCKDSASFRGLNGVETEVIIESNESCIAHEDTEEDSFLTATGSPREPTPPASPSILQPPSPPGPLLQESPQAGPSRRRLPTRPSTPLRLASPQPGSSSRQTAAVLRPNEEQRTTKKKAPLKRKITADDVYAIQYQIYEKKLQRQDKINLKLDLQIKLLKSLNDRSIPAPGTPTIQSLFASMY